MLHNINCHFYAFWSHLRTYGAIKLPITTTPITVRTVPVAMFPNVTVPAGRLFSGRRFITFFVNHGDRGAGGRLPLRRTFIFSSEMFLSIFFYIVICCQNTFAIFVFALERCDFTVPSGIPVILQMDFIGWSSSTTGAIKSR